jgi:hypothetical protein
MYADIYLVGGFNPSEKYESVGMIIPNIWKNTSNVPKHQPVVYISFSFDILDPILTV